jgi:hypothetical protein
MGVDNRDPPLLPPRRVEGGWWRFQRTPHRRGDTGEQTGAELVDRRAQCLVVGLQVQPVPAGPVQARQLNHRQVGDTKFPPRFGCLQPHH